MQVLNIFDCKQIIDKATRITESSRSITDHIFTNRKENLIQYDAIDIGPSDHLIIYCSRRISKGDFKHHNIITVRSLKNNSPEILLEKMHIIRVDSML